MAPEKTDSKTRGPRSLPELMIVSQRKKAGKKASLTSVQVRAWGARFGEKISHREEGGDLGSPDISHTKA